MRRAVPLALVLTLLLGSTAQAEEAEVGRVHPELRLPTIDGEATYSLRDMRGTRVLLLQFASW